MEQQIGRLCWNMRDTVGTPWFFVSCSFFSTCSRFNCYQCFGCVGIRDRFACCSLVRHFETRDHLQKKRQTVVRVSYFVEFAVVASGSVSRVLGCRCGCAAVVVPRCFSSSVLISVLGTMFGKRTALTFNVFCGCRLSVLRCFAHSGWASGGTVRSSSPAGWCDGARLPSSLTAVVRL